MASPRSASSILRKLSPRPARNIRLPTAPRTPIRNVLRIEEIDDADRTDPSRLSPFNIDTPNRVKILKDGLPQNQPHTVLGSGGFGMVVRASYKGDEVAAKIVRQRRGSETAVKAEEHATSLSHANIVRVLGVEQGSALSLITMELCGTSLQDRLESAPLAPEERISIWRSIANALQFCHNAGVVHADVKPRNVLMASDGQPKLADFGSSLLLNEPNLEPRIHGTPGYTAPEVVRGAFPGPAADVYSLGILAWQMLSRKAPFPGLHPHTILYLTGKGARPPDEDLNDDFDGKYKALYRRSWSENINDRPNIDNIIEELNSLEIEK